MRRSIFPVALLLAACNWGARPKTFAPANGPMGARVAVRVEGERRDRVGELYAVDSTAVYIMDGRLTRIAWRRLRAMDIDGLRSDYDVVPGERVGVEKSRRLATVSRFPQGLSGELLAQVLRLLGQPSLVEIASAEGGLDSVVRVATTVGERYANRALAVADGYRRIGADFPGMGEHWVNPVRIQASDRLDAEHPSFVSYATIRGKPTLLGVGYLVTTGADTSGIDLPGWPLEWHEHSGLLSDESGARLGRGEKARETRVWVLHVWTALPNPDGRHAADNWALPFARAGVSPPSDVDADAGRAYSLALGGSAFFIALLTDAGLRTPNNAQSVDSTLAAFRARASATAAGDVAGLRAVWAELGASLRNIVGNDVTALLQPAHPLRHAKGHAHVSR